MPRPGCNCLVFSASRGMGVLSDIDVTFAGDDLVLRLASAAYLARFTGSSRTHCGSDLCLYFRWCTEHHLLPPTARSANVRFCRILRYPGEVRQVEIPPDVAGMAIQHE